MLPPAPERNPYAPPETRVIDAEEPPRERPVAIKRAIVLMCIDLIFSLGLVLIYWREYTEHAPPLFMALYEFVAFSVMIWLLVKISVGRNWARITYLVLEAIFLPFMVADLPEVAAKTPLLAGMQLIVIGLDLSVLYLVFFPGRAYFAKTKS